MLEKSFWAEAVNTANFLRNRSPTKLLGNITPEECFSGRKPLCTNFKIFGCPCTYSVNERKKKLDARARSGLFMGYCDESSTCRIWDLLKRKIVYSRDVKFNEENIVRNGLSKKEVEPEHSENSENSENSEASDNNSRSSETALDESLDFSDDGHSEEEVFVRIRRVV